MISCIILTHNNENKIESVLTNTSWCEEQIIVDDDSFDRTREIAKSKKARVIQHSLNNDFASQRNIGLQEAIGDWVLFIDTDEYITPALVKEIQTIIQPQNAESQHVQGYYMKRKDVQWGRELRHGETGNIRLLRLARKGAGKWKRAVHEVWEISGKTKMCMTPLLHSPHPTVRSFLAQINRYTTINAHIFYHEGRRVNALKITLYPVAKFIQNYIFKLGFLDGVAGFVFAMMMAFHSFLTRAKMWQLQQDKGK